MSTKGTLPIDLEGKRLDIKAMKPSDKFLNRELSWLHFNMRVLEEAENLNHPVLERLRFLSISGSNLDEFYMVRVAGVRGQMESKLEIKSVDGLTPKEQIKNINKLAEQTMVRQQMIWQTLRQEMREKGIDVIGPDTVSAEEKPWLEQYFFQNVFPLVTPLAIDPAHPAPFIPNLGFTMALQLKRHADGHDMMALLPMPQQLQRFVRLPGEAIRFISIENLITLFFDLLFPGYGVVASGAFRIIRDSDIEIEEEAEDLVRVFESALKRRRRGRIIRLSLEAAMPKSLRSMIVKRMEAEPDTVMVFDGILGIKDVDSLIIDDIPNLTYAKYHPRYPERVRDFGGDIFKAIQAKDFVVHHPYESFDVVHDFVRQAAHDPNVVAIKQLLYRAGSQSEIINALIEAAEAGKSVTAVIELKARFDEEQNIKWARDLERVGVQVVYGVIGLKTHAKAALIVRREGEGLKSYAHLGTGNYHPITAKIYTDLSFFTTDKAIINDLNKLFNYVTGYVEPHNLEKLSMSPLTLRDTLVKCIEQETANAQAGKPAAIWAKLNALLDPDIIERLYLASCAGVQIDLVVRGICALRPGVKGLSENIRVRSIVGRFLEHARIICFGNGKKLPHKGAKVFMSSADWMPRNFYRRVETLVPIENETVHSQILDQIMVANLADTVQSWQMEANGHYVRLSPKKGIKAFSAHSYFMTNPSMSGMGTAVEETKPIIRSKGKGSNAG